MTNSTTTANSAHCATSQRIRETGILQRMREIERRRDSDAWPWVPWGLAAKLRKRNSLSSGAWRSGKNRSATTSSLFPVFLCLVFAVVCLVGCSDGNTSDRATDAAAVTCLPATSCDADSTTRDGAVAEVNDTLQSLDSAEEAGSDLSTMTLDNGTIKYARGRLSLDLAPSCPVITVGGSDYAAQTPVFASTASNKNEIVFNCSLTGTNSSQARLDGAVHYKLGDDGNLRKWAVVVPSGLSKDALVENVILEQLNTKIYGPAIFTDLGAAANYQSYPVFFDNFFAAVEYPVARTYEANDQVVLSHRPGLRVQNGQAITTRAAVVGLSARSQARAQFEGYLEKARPPSVAMHTTYDSWWSLQLPYSEQDAVKLLKTLKSSLFDPFGVSFDTFCLDLGWSAREGIWTIAQDRFPSGFGAIKKVADSMHTALGLWFSPSNLYSPEAFDSNWSAKAGYETTFNPGKPENPSLCTVMGGRYQQALKSELVTLIQKYGIAQIKVDGWVPTCDATDHGHPTDGYEMEAVADGIIDILDASRQANPTIWIESTCFTPNPSPFWLLHASSVLGAYGDGDDSPWGLVPAPTYRESYTTARDRFNLQGSDRLAAPVRYQDVLGVIHQTDEDFTNDAVMAALRGNDFLAFYVNPDNAMTTDRWARLASVLKWARNTQSRNHRTTTLRPTSFSGLEAHSLYPKDTMPREPYGYAHWGNRGGIVGLRNPWIARASYRLPTPAGAGSWQVVSQYPERCSYGQVTKGEDIEIPLRPYETLVLELSQNEPPVAPPTTIATADQTLIPGTHEQSSVTIDGVVRTTVHQSFVTEGPQTKLVLIFDDKAPIAPPQDPTVALDGASYAFLAAPDQSWQKTSETDQPEYWRIYSLEIPAGSHDLSLAFTMPANASKGYATAWLLTSKAGQATASTETLPQPEAIYLGSLQLF